MKASILIYTRDRFKAESLEKVLTSEGFTLLGKATALDVILVRRPDLVITDQIVQTHGWAKARFILLLPAFDSERIADGIKEGYQGFVTSDDGLPGLFECIRTVMEGEKHFSETVLDRLRRSGVAIQDDSAVKVLAQLSARERQILKMIAAGLSGKMIADQLFISYRTLTNHKANMTEKLQLESARNLLPFAISVKDYL